MNTPNLEPVFNTDRLAEKLDVTKGLLRAFLAKVDEATERPLRFRLDSMGEVYAADTFTDLEAERLGLLLPLRARDMALILEGLGHSRRVEVEAYPSLSNGKVH